MKQSTKKRLKKVGRPKIELDLNELEKLSSLNCTMPEIAHFFDIPLRTLEDKYTNDEKVRATIDRGRADGKISLRRQQIQIMNDGNPTMAIWLGKQLLGQTERTEISQDIKIEERKVLDLSRLTDNELNTIERALKYAVVDADTSRKDEEVIEPIHQKSLVNDRTK